MIYQSWRSPEDAIAWAISELPSHSPEWLASEFERLQPDERGKKAHLWVKFVEDLKLNEFAGDPKPKQTPPETRQIQASFAWGLAQKIGGKKK